MRAAAVDGLEGRDRAGDARGQPRLRAVAGSEGRTHMTGYAGDMAETTGTQDVEDVLEALRDVVDPELGINVVDLGLVYGVHLEQDGIATIDMTLTSAACPLTDVIED